VLGLLEGGDLRFHQDEHEIFPEHVLKFWCAQLTLCLEGLHKIGLIHRDVKPENILLDLKGYCHLSDFTGAVCQPLHERKYDPTYIGTIWYMGAYSSNICKRSGECGHSTDALCDYFDSVRGSRRR
jgi:serine/threonine protein kinase